MRSKKRVANLIVLLLVIGLFFSVSVVSAGWTDNLSNFWKNILDKFSAGTITGNAVSSSAAYSDISWGFPGGYADVGDYNGDGKAELVVYNPNGGLWYIAEFNNGLGNSLLFGGDPKWGFVGTVPVMGDYNGDGKDEMAVYQESTGDWYIAGMALIKHGGVGLKAIAADFDGDGKDDLATYTAGGSWYIRTVSGTVLTFGELKFGGGSLINTAGDIDGDGKAEVISYNPNGGLWYIGKLSSDYKSVSTTLAWGDLKWGFAGTVPVVGDFNKDGKDDLSVYNPSTQKWYVNILSYCSPINGGWSNYGAWYDSSGWSACSNCQQTKTQKRDRTCTNPSPSCGGTSCSGSSYETKTISQPCGAINGGWSSPSNSGTCGQSIACKQKQIRTCTNPAPSCGGTQCSGDSQLLINCGDGGNYGCSSGQICSNGACINSQIPTSTCTSFTYSNWGACNSSGKQTRTITSSLPSGCTGGNPVTTQSCNYVPPTIPQIPTSTCTSFTYSNWGACNSSGKQTRTITSSLPSGCTGGSSVTTQSCNYVPPTIPPTCTDECSLNGFKECFEYGRGYKTCGNYDSDICLEWSAMTFCSGGCLYGSCVGSCNPSCSGKSCGYDGCGGSCGTCGAGESCFDFSCIQSPAISEPFNEPSGTPFLSISPFDVYAVQGKNVYLNIEFSNPSGYNVNGIYKKAYYETNLGEWREIQLNGNEKDTSDDWTKFDAQNYVKINSAELKEGQNRIIAYSNYGGWYVQYFNLHFVNAVECPLFSSKCNVYDCASLTRSNKVYILQKNIEDIIGTCFILSSSDIALNGNGFSITGDFTGSGISLESLENVKISNLTVIGFENGIQVSNTLNSEFKNNTLINNTRGIFLEGVSYGNKLNSNNIIFEDNPAVFSILDNVYRDDPMAWETYLNSLIYENENGRIEWLNPEFLRDLTIKGQLAFPGNIAVDEYSADFDWLPEDSKMNSLATITLFNIRLDESLKSNIQIWNNDIDTGIIPLETNPLKFKVERFS